MTSLNDWDAAERAAGRSADQARRELPKLLLVSHYLPPSRYGQPRVIQRLLQDLPPTSYCLASVETYDRSVTREDQDAPWLPGPYFKLDAGARWTFLLKRRPLNRYARLIEAGPAILRRARQIQQLIERERCEIAVACSGDIVDLPATWLACRRTKCRFIAYMFDDYVEQWAFQPALRRLAAVLERRFVADAATVVVPNEFLRREYVARYARAPNLLVINNPWLSTPAQATGAKVRSDGPARIAYTGSIYHVHFDAFRNLTQALQTLDGKARLDIYSATTPDILQANGIEGYHHGGHVSDAEAVEVQRDADILFLPLAFRSTAQAVIRTSAPGKMGEYLASGRPVLVHVPDDTFIAWYCREHGCAEVVTDPDPAALARAVERLLVDTDYRDRLVLAARRKAEEDFSPEAARSRFGRLIAGKASAPSSRGWSAWSR